VTVGKAKDAQPRRIEIRASGGQQQAGQNGQQQAGQGVGQHAARSEKQQGTQRAGQPA